MYLVTIGVLLAFACHSDSKTYAYYNCKKLCINAKHDDAGYTAFTQGFDVSDDIFLRNVFKIHVENVPTSLRIVRGIVNTTDTIVISNERIVREYVYDAIHRAFRGWVALSPNSTTIRNVQTDQNGKTCANHCFDVKLFDSNYDTGNNSRDTESLIFEHHRSKIRCIYCDSSHAMIVFDSLNYSSTYTRINDAFSCSLINNSMYSNGTIYLTYSNKWMYALHKSVTSRIDLQ